MERPSAAAASAVLLACTAAWAGSQEPTPAASPSPSIQPVAAFDGAWKGTTSQEKPISLGIKADALAEFRLGWSIEFEKLCRAPDTNLPQKTRQGTHVLRFQVPETLSAGSFKTQVGVESDLDLTLSGTFSADGAVGQIEITTVPSSPCKGAAKATWKAKRD